MSSVAIVLNGEPTAVEPGLSVADLLQQLRVEPRRVVVEHNRRILRGEELASVTIEDGDELELVHFVGGG